MIRVRQIRPTLITLLRFEPNASPRRLPKDLEFWKQLQKAHQGTDAGDPLFHHGFSEAFESPQFGSRSL